MDISLLIYLAVFLCGAMANWIVREVMLTQANQQLSDEERIRRTLWSRNGIEIGEMSRLWHVHRQIQPNSSLRFWYFALWIFTPSWMFFGLSLVQRLIR